MKHNKSVEQLYDVDFNDIIHKMTILVSTPTCNSIVAFMMLIIDDIVRNIRISILFLIICKCL